MAHHGPTAGVAFDGKFWSMQPIAEDGQLVFSSNMAAFRVKRAVKAKKQEAKRDGRGTP